MIPAGIHAGTEEQYAALRLFLRARYSEEIAAAALGVSSVGEFHLRQEGSALRDPIVQIFFAGAAVPTRQIRAALPPSLLDTFSKLGLLSFESDAVWCPVLLYPAFGLHLVSDRFTEPDGSAFTGDREFVYFALTPTTQSYIQTLPAEPCASFLDIGAGCGAAALVQARHCDVAVATDISERCCEFARFNVGLNGTRNVEVLQGSLYEPVRGRRFDRIGCHPPYDVTSGAPWTFADGGDDGEFVIRGVVAGLPEHLNAGGEFIAQFRAGDQRGKPLEVRIREWLGEKNEEFDIALVVRSLSTPEEYAVGAVFSTGGDAVQYRAMLDGYRGKAVEQLVYCSVLLRRKTTVSQPLTLRRTAGERCGYEELRWLLDYGTHLEKADLSGRMLSPSPGMELVVRHKPIGGKLQAIEYSLVSTVPFSATTEVPEWMAFLVSECTGEKTAAEIFQTIREQGIAMEHDQFDSAIRLLLSSGVLYIPRSTSRL